jgi:phage gp45-like
MHTDDGTVFTDFPLRGTASGTSETIVGNVGDKNSHAIDIQAHDGSIRLLQLKPQI